MADKSSSHDDGFLLPLAIWLSITLLALGIPALRIPLSANYPRPAESMALHVFLVSELVLSALLFPVLFRNWRFALLIILVTWPFVFLAGFLAFISAGRAALCALYLSFWLLALRLFGSLLSNHRARLAGIAIATSIVLGGPLLWYLSVEFSGRLLTFRDFCCLGPVSGALSLIQNPNITLTPWAFLALLWLVLLSATFIHRRLRIS